MLPVAGQVHANQLNAGYAQDFLDLPGAFFIHARAEADDGGFRVEPCKAAAFEDAGTVYRAQYGHADLGQFAGGGDLLAAPIARAEAADDGAAVDCDHRVARRNRFVLTPRHVLDVLDTHLRREGPASGDHAAPASSGGPAAPCRASTTPLWDRHRRQSRTGTPTSRRSQPRLPADAPERLLAFPRHWCIPIGLSRRAPASPGSRMRARGETGMSSSAGCNCNRRRT